MRKETRFPYDRLVADGIVDREAWAVVVQELLDLEAKPLVDGGKLRVHGAKTRFAAKIGITARTVDTWLGRSVDVKEANVRAVAKGYDLNPMDLLIRVGFYSSEQMPVRYPDEVIDEEQRRVLDDDTIPDDAKVLILEELELMRMNDAETEELIRERNRQARGRRVQQLIDQASKSS